MAIVTGPLHSDQAHGQFGQTLIYERSKGRTWCKPYKEPAKRFFPGQRYARSMISFFSANWSLLDDSEKASWLSLANSRSSSVIAEFCRYQFERVKSGKGPSLVYPATELFSPVLLGDFIATGLSGSILIHPDILLSSNVLSAFIFLNSPEYHSISLIVERTSPLAWTDSYIYDLQPGDYLVYYRLFGIDGILHDTMFSIGSVTVT